MHEERLDNDQIRKRAARGAASVFTRHAIVRLMAFAGTLLLARLLDPHTFGVFALAQLVLSLVGAIAVGGITTALTRRKEAIPPQEYATAHGLQLAIALASFLLVVAATPALAAAYDLTPGEALAFPAMGLAVFLLASRSIPTAALQRSFRHDLVAVSEVSEYLTYLVISTGCALLGFGLWALVAATIARYLVATVILYRMARSAPSASIDRAIARQLLKEAGPQQVTIVLGLSQRAINSAGVAATLNAAAAGLVGMATTLLDSLVLQPLTLLANIQFRLLAQAQDDPARFRRVLENCYFLSAALCLPILVGATLLFPLVVSILFPPAWSGTGYLVQALSIASMTQLVANPTIQALKALRQTGSLMAIYAVSALVQLAILIATAPALGLTGFAIANIASSILTMLAVVVRLSKTSGRVPPLMPIAGIGAAAAIAASAGAGVWIVLPAPFDVIGAAIVGAAAYACLLPVFAPKLSASHLEVAAGALPVRLAALRPPLLALASLTRGHHDRVASLMQRNRQAR